MAFILIKFPIYNLSLPTYITPPPPPNHHLSEKGRFWLLHANYAHSECLPDYKQAARWFISDVKIKLYSLCPIKTPTQWGERWCCGIWTLGYGILDRLTDTVIFAIIVKEWFHINFSTFWMQYGFNPFKPNGISHCYQLEQSISVLRDVGWYFSIFFKF